MRRTAGVEDAVAGTDSTRRAMTASDEMTAAARRNDG